MFVVNIMKILECVESDNGESLEDTSVSMQSDVGSKITLPSDVIPSLEAGCGNKEDDLCTSLNALSMQDATLTKQNAGSNSDLENVSSVIDGQDVQLTLDLKMMSLEDGCQANLISTEASKTEANVDEEKSPSVSQEHAGRGLPQEHEDTSAEGSQNNTVYIARGPHGGIPATPTAAAPYPWPEHICRQLHNGHNYGHDYGSGQPAKFIRPNNTNVYGNGAFLVDSSVPLTTDTNWSFDFGSSFNNCQVSQTVHTGMLSGGGVTVQHQNHQQQPTTTYLAAPAVSSVPQVEFNGQQGNFVDDIINEWLLDPSPDSLDDFFPSGDLLSSGQDAIPIPVPSESSDHSDVGYFSPPYTNTSPPYSAFSPSSLADTESSLGVYTDDHSRDSHTCLDERFEDIFAVINKDLQPTSRHEAYPLNPPICPQNSTLIMCHTSMTTSSVADEFQCATSMQVPNQDFFVSKANFCSPPPGQCAITPSVTNIPSSVKDATGMQSTQTTTKRNIPSKLREIRPKPQQESLASTGNMTTNIIAGVNGSGFHVPPPLPCEQTLVKSDEDCQRHFKFCRELAAFQKSQLLFQDPDGDTLLHLAVARKELTFIAALLPRMKRDELIPQLINKVNQSNWTPLHMAVMANQVAAARELIKYGANVNIQIHRRRDGNNYIFLQPVHLAAAKGYQWTNMLEVLLSAPDVDVHAFDSEGRTALHRAVEEHDGVQVDCRRTIYLLVQAGADLAKQDQRTGETALHYAIRKKNVEFVAWILGLVCEMVKKTTCPEQLEHLQRVALSNIINMRSNGNPGVTPLQIAFNLRPVQASHEQCDKASHEQRQRVKIMELLLRNGATLSSRTDSSLRKELSNIPELKELVRNIANSSRNGNS